MKIHFNKYEYFLILMVNILLLLCIVFTTQNCKENNRLRISGFHKNAVKDTLKEEHKYDYNQQNIKEKVQKKNHKLIIKVSDTEKESYIDNNLYKSFSIYSFFNY
jgi:hypothetical protein